MTRVKVNRISEKGINLPPTEYDDEQPIIKQITTYLSTSGQEVIGIGEDSLVYQWSKVRHIWYLWPVKQN